MQISKKLIFFFYLIVFVVILSIFFLGLSNYRGNKFIYFLFSIVSNYLIYFCFRKNSNFFETFFGIFLWLGFWFKLTVIISFSDGTFREGAGIFDYTKNSFDQVLQISLIAILGFIISGIFREKFFYKYSERTKKVFQIKNFMKNRRKTIWTIFLILCTMIAFFNIYLQVYQRGLFPTNNYNFLFSGVFKWLLLFGLSSIATVIIFFEIKSFKKIYFLSLIFIFFQNFLSYSSMLSRGMIFNSLSIFYSTFKFSKRLSISIDFKIYFKIVFVLIILFYFQLL